MNVSRALSAFAVGALVISAAMLPSQPAQAAFSYDHYEDVCGSYGGFLRTIYCYVPSGNKTFVYQWNHTTQSLQFVRVLNYLVERP